MIWLPIFPCNTHPSRICSFAQAERSASATSCFGSWPIQNFISPIPFGRILIWTLLIWLYSHFKRVKEDSVAPANSWPHSSHYLMLIKRLITSSILIPVFLAALFLLPDTYWALLMLAVVGVGLKEWAILARFNIRGQFAYVFLPVVVLGYLVLTGAPWSDQLLSLLMFYGILLGVFF